MFIGFLSNGVATLATTETSRGGTSLAAREKPAKISMSLKMLLYQAAAAAEGGLVNIH